MNSCRTPVSGQLSSSNLPSTTQDQSSHSARAALELFLHRREHQGGSAVCAGKQKQKERIGRRGNILRCQRCSTVPITDHFHMSGVKNTVNNPHLPEVQGFHQLKSPVLWDHCLSVQGPEQHCHHCNRHVISSKLKNKSSKNTYEVQKFFLLPSEDFINVFSKLLLKRFVAQDFFSGIFNNQLLENSFEVVRSPFLTSLEKEHEFMIDR